MLIISSLAPSKWILCFLVAEWAVSVWAVQEDVFESNQVHSSSCTLASISCFILRLRKQLLLTEAHFAGMNLTAMPSTSTTPAQGQQNSNSSRYYCCWPETQDNKPELADAKSGRRGNNWPFVFQRLFLITDPDAHDQPRLLSPDTADHPKRKKRSNALSAYRLLHQVKPRESSDDTLDSPGMPVVEKIASRNLTLSWSAPGWLLLNPSGRRVEIAYYLIIVQQEARQRSRLPSSHWQLQLKARQHSFRHLTTTNLPVADQISPVSDSVLQNYQQDSNWPWPGKEAETDTGASPEADTADAAGEEFPRPRRIRTPDNATSFTVTHLSPFTQYTFQIIAVDSVGVHSRLSPASQPIVTRTEPPGHPPVLIVAHSPTSTSIRLQWLPPHQQQWHAGLLRGYRLTYRRAHDQHTHELIIDNPQVQTYEIRHGLQAFSRYYISLQTFNEDGYSPAHTEVVMTAEGVPSAPHHLLLGDVTESSVSLSWLPPAERNGILRGYKLHYTHPAGFTDSLTISLIIPAVANNIENVASDNSIRHHHQLIDLSPFSIYQVSVSAFTSKGEGPRSASLSVLTDTRAPGTPHILNVTRVAENALLLEWTPPSPSSVSKQLDLYLIHYYLQTTDQLIQGPKEVVVAASRPKNHTKTKAQEEQLLTEQAILANLSGTTSGVYRISVIAATRSVVDVNLLYRGESSPVYSFSMAVPGSSTAVSGDSSDGPLQALDTDLSTGEMVIIVTVIAFLGLFAIACGLFCAFRKRVCLGSYSYLAASNSPKCQKKKYLQQQFAGTDTLLTSSFTTGTSLPICNFPTHVKKLYADGQIGLSKEFDSLAIVLQAAGNFVPSVNESLRLENRCKNRYKNVLAYDHSRVKLKPVIVQQTDNLRSELSDGKSGEGDDDGAVKCGCSPTSRVSTPPANGPLVPNDYINANFVDSFDSPAAYIVAQAPMSNTVVDWWNMIWDNDVRVVIMLTNLDENGRRKCEQYWPSFSSDPLLRNQVYGPFLVSTVQEISTAFYIVRSFLLLYAPDLHSDISPSNLARRVTDCNPAHARQVLQYMYCDWPDHGRPDVTVPLVRFIIKSSRSFEEDIGPPIVHCSAGVGRSGCYIALHSMIKQMDRSGHVDIFAYLLAARKQRMGLCQNESQYALIHDSVLEYIQSGQTEVYVATYEEYYGSLLKDDMLGLREQLAVITDCQMTVNSSCPISFDYANEPFNRSKNRCSKFIPTDVSRNRVSITPQPAVAGSDYINASFLPSFKSLRQFIITQFPLDSTIDSFWQMIWDFKVETMVVIGEEESSYNHFIAPPEQERNFGTFHVCTEDGKRDFGGDGLCCRLTGKEVYHSSHDQVTFVCRIVTVKTEQYDDVGSLVESVGHVQSLIKRLDETVVVMDEFGGPAAGLFAALFSVRQQALTEASVDLYQIARLYNQARPGVFGTLETYVKFHSAARAICAAAVDFFPVEKVCFSGFPFGLQPACPSNLAKVSKRLSSILEEDQSS